MVYECEYDLKNNIVSVQLGGQVLSLAVLLEEKCGVLSGTIKVKKSQHYLQEEVSSQVNSFPGK